MGDSMKKLIGYFDFQCPYCYLGINYARKMASEFDFEIEWRPINIHPEIPETGKSIEEVLPHVADLSLRIQNLRNLAESVELPVVDCRWIPSTQKALEAMEYARDCQKEHIFMSAVFNAYFGAGLDIGKDENLIQLIEAIGLSGEELQKVWHEKRYEKRMNHYIDDARSIELDVVPTLAKEKSKVLEATTTMTFQEYQEKFRRIWD
jgi:Predicted dithiol-disulfide isomerase involved in polyketide biosynthesis